jgi:hypothetical protein
MHAIHAQIPWLLLPRDVVAVEGRSEQRSSVAVVAMAHWWRLPK